MADVILNPVTPLIQNGTSSPDAVGPLHPMPVSGQGSGAAPVSSASLTSVASTPSNVQLIAGNANRKGVILVNTDANILYLKYGATATSTSFTALIPGGGYWEMPGPIFTGEIDGIWSADGSGSAFITEL